MIIVHLTPHLGGGVGRALLGVAETAAEGINHIFICIEKPQKSQFVDAINLSGHDVVVSPDDEELYSLIHSADIVQVEWWSHPALLACLNSLTELPMRLLLWCHVSGIYHEKIPEALLNIAQKVILTSPCSYQAPQIECLLNDEPDKLDVIYSNGGLEDWPLSETAEQHCPLSIGYIGSLNFSKIHPEFISFFEPQKINNTQIKMIGDIQNKQIFLKQACEIGQPELLDFIGYSTNIEVELSKLNVLVYLLNPTHYGTNENVLLEAMAMGVVPIVLNNPAEAAIVEHGKTGFIVESKQDFVDTLNKLDEDPSLRREIGLNASRYVKKTYTKKTMQSRFSVLYKSLMCNEKRIISFKNCFGEKPSDWFLVSRQEPSVFLSSGDVKLPEERFAHYAIKEKTKGSVSHFQSYFSTDSLLNQWAEKITALL